MLLEPAYEEVSVLLKLKLQRKMGQCSYARFIECLCNVLYHSEHALGQCTF